MKRLAAVCMVVLVAAGCGDLTRRRDRRAAPAPTTFEYGDPGATLPASSGRAPAPAAGGAGATGAGEAKTTGTIVLALDDGRGGRPEGITVEIRGPVSLDVRSDAKGEGRADVPPGSYTFAIPVGCRDEVKVLFGGTGRAGVAAAGQTVRGTLRVDWKHRSAPGPAVHASYTPDFPLGETVDIRFDVRDRCTDDKAPNASFRTFTFRPSPVLKVVGTPVLKADAQGWGYIKVTCTAEGEAKLFSVDGSNPSDELELLRQSVGVGQPMCKRL